MVPYVLHGLAIGPREAPRERSEALPEGVTGQLKRTRRHGLDFLLS